MFFCKHMVLDFIFDLTTKFYYHIHAFLRASETGLAL